MRTFLWANCIQASDKCKDFSTVVYLYEFQTRDLGKKAVQNVWSKILFDLKQEMGGKIILIPIASDSDLASTDAMMRNFNITKFPVVIINNRYIVEELSTVEDLKKYLE